MMSWREARKSFGANHVLRGVSLDVAKGESCVVIGGSGTGKSVLIKTALGLIPLDGGEFLVEGAAPEHEALMERVGVLFQGGALFDSLKVWENVAFRFLRGARRLKRAAARELAVEKLRRVGLSPDVADRAPAELSGGMQKRAALARAIAAEPEILFIDEPTAGLDPIMSAVINELIRDIVTETGATAIAITHDLRTLRTIADHVAMLRDGVILWRGTLEEMDKAEEPYLKRFIGGHAEGRD